MKRTLEIGGVSGLLTGLVEQKLGHKSLQTCLGCSACSNVCPVSGRAGTDPCMLLQLILEDRQEEALNTPWMWYCSHCASCFSVCPMSIDIPSVVHLLKSFSSVDMLPLPVQQEIEKWVATGNSCSMYPDQYLGLVAKAQDILRKRTGLKDITIPIDKKRARLLLLIDPAVLKARPSVLADYATVFHLTGESWTLPSSPFGTSDLSLITGREELGELWLQRIEGLASNLGVDKVILDDCQNRLSPFGPKDGFKKELESALVTSIPFLVFDYLQSGRLNIKKKACMITTFQQPCSCPDDQFRTLIRALLERLCTEVKEMVVPVENSVCCGGGLLRAGLEEQMEAFDAAKALQMEKVEADAVITFCLTCFLQFIRLKGLGFIRQSVLFFPEILSSALF